MTRSAPSACFRRATRPSTHLARSLPSLIPQTRFASTSTNPPPTASTSTSSDPNGPLPMTWPAYLSLRRQRRLYSTFTTVPTTFGGLFAGLSYFASVESDPTQLVMGMEPMIVYGGATVGCMLLGYLLGPTLGSTMFSLSHPSLARGNPAPLEVMDRELFARIRRNRVDPSFQSVNNPAPDFYGEKIISIPTYRRWLRDQAAYKRKAMHGVPAEDT